MLQILRLLADKAQDRADQHTGDQIAEDGAEAEAGADRHQNDGGDQIDGGIQQ